jgi:hypothetical protein
MVDELFGELTWDELSEVWATSVALPYFRGFGENLEPEPATGAGSSPSEPELTPGRLRMQQALEAELAQHPLDQQELMRTIIAAAQSGMAQGAAPVIEEESDPLDPDRLFRQGRFLLEIDTSRRKPPIPAQRQGWVRLTARGDVLWDELMELLLLEYQVQQPVRARWWKAVYGEYQLQRALPAVQDVAGLRELLRPSRLRIRRAASKAGCAEVEVHLACTWSQDNLEVVVPDGKRPVLEPGSVMPWERAPRQKLMHPAFGSLGRADDSQPWTGFVSCEPFRDYQALVADLRASFQAGPEAHGPPRSMLRWDFIHGLFELHVYTGPGEEPSAAQAAALRTFKEHEAANAAVIVEAVFAHYRSVYEEVRSEYYDRYRDANVPEPTGPDLLYERLQLLRINVFPPDTEGEVRLGFIFLCSWDPGSDLGVRWRAGTVEAVGGREVGRP